MFNSDSILTQKANLQKQEWYELLVEECKAIIVETTFSANELVIKGKWLLGDRVVQDEERLNVNFKDNKYYSDKGEKVIDYLAEKIGISPRELRRCIQFKIKWPTLVMHDQLDLNPFNNEGKSISWFKIANIYLPESSASEKELDEIVLQHKCPKCGYEW